MRWVKFKLLSALVRRDFEARYKGSVLGRLWPVINQLSQLLIYTYVFAIVLQVKLSLKELSQDNPFTFGLWLFSGLVAWIAFSGGLGQAASSVVVQSTLVKKVVFPLVLLPLVPILSTFIESMFGLALLIVAVAILTGNLHPTLALLPLIWIPQLMFTAGFAYLAASLTVFIRDIPQAIGILLNLWFYLTPIVYPTNIIPEPVNAWILWLNPMATLVEVYRDLVLVGQIGHMGEWIGLSTTSFLLFWVGLLVYRRLSYSFADVL
ncbi:MAG: ABC transporter permease [Pseudanabaenales cyanobacterium]|nr:ABC transporter permease [Pseudanabaenales cyanobacterium]